MVDVVELFVYLSFVYVNDLSTKRQRWPHRGDGYFDFSFIGSTTK